MVVKYLTYPAQLAILKSTGVCMCWEAGVGGCISRRRIFWFLFCFSLGHGLI